MTTKKTDYLDVLNTQTICVNHKSTPYLSFYRYDEIPFIKHCFTTKLGGVSEGIFSSLNLSYSRGDNIDNVKENYNKICSNAGFTLKNIVMSDQVHETTVLNITEDILSSLDNDDFSKRKLNSVDGMITNLKNVPLITYYADCVPLYFVDVENKAVGLSHSGWRGTAALMGFETVKAMKQSFGTNPQKLICAIGPSICQDCYEVSTDVIEQLTESFFINNIVDNASQLENVYYKKSNKQYQLNLWEANRLILKKAGVKNENIIVSNLCTCHNSNLLFSHRATNGKRGNLAAIIEII